MKRKNLRIRTSWLCIILLVIILLCCLFLIYAIQMHQAIRNTEETDNLRNANNVKTILDDTWDTMLSHCLSLANLSSAKELESAQDIEQLQQYGAYNLYMDIRNAIAFDPILDDITLYYPGSDYIIGKMGVKKFRTYWATTYGLNEKVSLEQWEEALYNSKHSGYFTVRTGNSCELFYRYSFGNNLARVLVVRISADAISDRLGWVQGSSPNSFAAVIDADGNIYASDGNIDAFVDQETARLLPVDDNYLYTSLSSSIDGISYLMATKKSDVFRLSSSTVLFALLLLVAAVTLSVPLAYWLIRRHVTPLEEMAVKLSKTNNLHQNELDIINAAIEDILKEQDTLNVLSKQQQLVISRAFLNELLQDNPLDKKNPEDIAAVYGISFENAHYCIVARKCGPLDTEESTISLLMSFEESVPVYWTRQSNIDIFLINTDIPESCNTWKNLLENHSSQEACICISNCVDTPLMIMDCWLHCAKDLGCLNLLPSAYLQKTIYHTNPADPILEQFQQCLVAGDYRSAQLMADDLFVQYAEDSDPFFFSYKCFRLVHILLPHCSRHMRHSLVLLTQTHSRSEWVHTLHQILRDIASGQQQEPHRNDIAEKVKSIIMSQYSNPMLDLRMLSSQINLSQSYISRMFKQKYGTSVAQYINAVRIEKAKELILGGDDSIKAIAIKVGFAGDAQFIRAFKRQEDVTPGNFRSNKAT